MPVSREAAAWGMRFLLGREPDSEDAIDELRRGHDTLEALRAALLRSPEVRMRLTLGGSGQGNEGRYAVPAFLLRPPGSPGIPWRFEPPTLAHPVSQLCTAAQMRQPEYAAIARQLGVGAELHRKFWEFGFIVSALRAKGVLAPGRRGLGFGTGQEPLPAIFAAAGVEVVATDVPEDEPPPAGRAASAPGTDGVEKFWRPDVIGREEFFERVSFRPADMRRIDPALEGFDFNWSASCMDQLGSIRNGLDFLHDALETLRPGGVAVHTTEFNVDSNEDTLETANLSIFRRRDFETVFAELVGAGHAVEPLNTWPGVDAEDEYVDSHPFGLPHLKLNFGGHRTTSIGLIITKKH